VIDAMTLVEAGEIFSYWERHPPAHLMLQTIARLFGWVPQAAPAAAMSIGDIAAAAPPGLVVARGGEFGMPAPLDLERLRAKNRARVLAIARRNSAVTGA
jgi:hypothetical protein